jgi:hypothetical protein
MGKLVLQNIDNVGETDTLADGFGKVNETHRLLESLVATEGASIIGIEAASGFTGINVQDVLEELDAKFLIEATIQVMVNEASSDRTPAGVLVYPSELAEQNFYYNADSTINYTDCTYDTKTWTMTFSYDALGNVDQIDSTDGVAGNWQQLITYDTDNTVLRVGVWT